jgi:hypothetical protein
LSGNDTKIANAKQISEFHNIEIQIHLKMDFAAEKIMTGQEFFDRILLAEGLAHIAENIFDQLDGETLVNCESVGESWQQFFINNGHFFYKFWKRQYLQKLAKPGTDAHRLIQSNPKLFQYFDQADQGTFHIFTRIGMTCNAGLTIALLLLGQICSEYCIFDQFQPTMPVCTNYIHHCFGDPR